MKKKSETQKENKLMKFEELSWKQIDKLDRKKTIFFLPISPLEEHGPHLPVGTDILTINDTTTEAVKILNKKKPDLNYVLFPLIPIGFLKSNADFPGSISVNTKVIRNVIYSYGEALANHGFKYMVICTYHMSVGHLKGIHNAKNKLESRYGMKISEPCGPFYHNKEVEKREPKLGFDTSKEVHACFRETSLMKYQYPYLVDESYKNLQDVYKDLKSPITLGKSFKQLGFNEGYIGSPSKADADYGRWLYCETANVIAQSALDLYEGKKQAELPASVKTAMKGIFWR